MSHKFLFFVLITATISCIHGSSINMLTNLPGFIDEASQSSHASSYSTTDLHCAVQNRNLEEIKMLLAAGAEANARDDDGETPLLIESKSEEPGAEIIEALLDYTNTTNKNFALCYAVIRGHPEKIRAFIEHKSYDRSYTGALHHAVKYKNLSIVNLLLDSGASVTDSYEDLTPLMTAIINNDLTIATILINAGALANEAEGYCLLRAKKQNILTLLQRSAWYNQQEMTKLLLDSKADPNLRYDEGDISALMIAAKKNHKKIAKMLIDAGADTNAVWKRERIASKFEDILDWGISRRIKNPETQEIIALVDVTETALDMTTKYNNQEIANLLEANGAKKRSSCSIM